MVKLKAILEKQDVRMRTGFI